MQNKINTIDVHELKKRYEDNPNLLLIDVRELSEWQEARIPWAQHLPKGELGQNIQTHCLEMNTPIYLHCRSGKRSVDAAQLLLSLGYQQVYSIAGGIIDWINAEYEYI